MSIMAVVLAAANPVFANIFREARIYVPFDFYLEGELLPAGNYTFNLGQATDSSIIVRSADGTAVRLLMTKCDSDRNSRKAYLQFNHDGDRYFLSSIVIGSRKASLTGTAVKAELWAQARIELEPYALAQK
jgi:hypothetical protein